MSLFGMAGIASVVVRGAAYCWSLIAFSVIGLRAIWEGSITKRPSRVFWDDVAKARDRFWDLSQSHETLTHAFYHASDGRQVHYVTNNASSDTGKRKNLVFFVHGWPDSWMLWRNTISSMPFGLAGDTTFVALDLPGHGGSDGLNSYGPDEMMEAVAEFIVAMREQYLDTYEHDGQATPGKVIVVAHDWGAICAFRLAVEAAQLADRYVLINSVLVPLALENVKRRWIFARRMLTTWTREPLKLRLLKIAASTLLPVLSQIYKSGYIFVFNLPPPIPTIFGSLGNMWFLRYAYSLALGRRHGAESQLAVTQLANSLGPSVLACKTLTLDKQAYSASVRRRAMRGTWTESVRLYRGGLATQPWTKSLTTIAALHDIESSRRKSSAVAGLFDTAPPGALRAPATVIWGAKDPALDARIMTEGFADYFARGSQLIVLPRMGHWVPLHAEGCQVVAAVVAWALEGEVGDVAERAAGACSEAKLAVVK